MLNIPFQLDSNSPYGVSPYAIDLDNILCGNYIACSFHALGHIFSTGASQLIFVTEAGRVQLVAEVHLTV